MIGAWGTNGPTLGQVADLPPEVSTALENFDAFVPFVSVWVVIAVMLAVGVVAFVAWAASL